MAQSAQPAETAATHAQAPVLLAHVHLQRRYTADAIEYVSPNEDVPGRQVDLPKLRRGGVKYIWLSEGAPGEFAVDPELSRQAATAPNHRPAGRIAFHGGSEVQRLLRGWDAVQRLCAAYPDHLGFARSVREARSLVARGLVAVFWHTESLLLANDLAALRAYHALGLRATGLVHAAPLDWIDSDKEQHRPGGLTDFGRRVIRELNALGIVVDVSHASDDAIRDVVAESRHPVVATHSNVRRLAPVRRNLSDDLIKAIAGGGGVIGVHCSSAFVDASCLEGRRGLERPQIDRLRYDMIGKVQVGAIDPFAFEAEYKGGEAFTPDAVFPTVTLDRLIDHVDELVNLVGVSHVGVGTDFQFLADAVQGFEGVQETPNLTAALLARGYPAEAVTSILGGNFLRVMEAVIGE
jgi:membrane dipeptidase